MQKDINIMLIEDEPDIITLTKKTLLVGGFENINIINTYKEFLLKIENEKKPDVILLDIYLGDKNGIEIIKHIKANEKYRNIKIIVFTAIADKEKIKELIKAGADDFVIKPFDPYFLIERIKDIVRAI